MPFVFYFMMKLFKVDEVKPTSILKNSLSVAMPDRCVVSPPEIKIMPHRTIPKGRNKKIGLLMIID